MIRFIFILTIFISVSVAFFYFRNKIANTNGAPPYLSEDLEPPDNDPLAFLRNWKRPEGPARVGLQVGHWKNDEVPEELKRLKGNTGATGGGKSEWEVNMQIAALTAEKLKAQNIEVDILPATIPSNYWADVFVSIHADGSTDNSKSGFKIAHPRRDYTNNASVLLANVEEEYEKATLLPKDPNVSRNMRGYYAFAWWRYDHAIHPMTTAIILETGFLTSPADRRTIVGTPEKPATGLAAGIIKFLSSQDLLAKN